MQLNYPHLYQSYQYPVLNAQPAYINGKQNTNSQETSHHFNDSRQNTNSQESSHHFNDSRQKYDPLLHQYYVLYARQAYINSQQNTNSQETRHYSDDSRIDTSSNSSEYFINGSQDL